MREGSAPFRLFSIRPKAPTLSVMQRLFSTFADGWPGAGLFLQRLLICSALLHIGIAQILETSKLASIVPPVIGAAAGILLLVGLWTPIAGALAAILEVWNIFSRAGDLCTATILATLATALAMIGPGAWS